MLYPTEPELAYPRTQKYGVEASPAGIVSISVPEPVPVSVLENRSSLGLLLCTVTVVALETAAFRLIFVCTCRLLPIVRALGVTKPFDWTVKLSEPPAVGLADVHEGCVSVTEPAPVLRLLAVKFVLTLLVPPVNVSGDGDNVPRVDGATAMATLQDWPEATCSYSTKPPLPLRRAAPTVSGVTSDSYVVNDPPMPLGPCTTNAELAGVTVAVPFV
jgi:hypothetical protein